ncbi:hypothetical protein M758_3G069900 [Ceratodon purpureus]|uniref:Secreted protein n=1 Tax=Ceratodon purpureus TaxID=3225 RepID=A0A8T0IFM1_CERPU|nr:hypothetical protein KC19_3G069900 [Ceratodon purpureus]KAG0622072.1 hypothetical protein M758_3G069900 [Ceratodon purpureus]
MLILPDVLLLCVMHGLDMGTLSSFFTCSENASWCASCVLVRVQTHILRVVVRVYFESTGRLLDNRTQSCSSASER